MTKKLRDRQLIRLQSALNQNTSMHIEQAKEISNDLQFKIGDKIELSNQFKNGTIEEVATGLVVVRTSHSRSVYPINRFTKIIKSEK